MTKGNLNVSTHTTFEDIFSRYPDKVHEKMSDLRSLIRSVAQEDPEVSDLEETVKWGEPSFKTKYGSTLRIDWKPKKPTQYFMFFQCNSRLIETFKIVFGDLFEFEGKRALVFQLDEEVPSEELKECIRATLRYHKVKDQLTLGI